MIAADEARRTARDRHPCVRSPVPADRLRDRVADALELDGVAHPVVAAAVLEVRGRAGLDVEAFARRAGVDIDVVHGAEAGQLSREQLPGPLRRMVPR